MRSSHEVLYLAVIVRADLVKVIQGHHRKSSQSVESVCYLPSDQRMDAHHPFYQTMCTTGRRSGSGSATRSTSWVTGGMSPSPNRMNCTSWTSGLPSVQSK